MSQNTSVPQQIITLDQLYRDYGEAAIQLEIAQGRVMQIKSQIQQALNQQPIR